MEYAVIKKDKKIWPTLIGKVALYLAGQNS